MIKEAISLLVGKKDLPSETARECMRELLSGAATPAQAAAFLLALRMKGESVGEISGLAIELREKMVGVNGAPPGTIDIVGTGGDGSGSFNISSAASLVVAGAGVAVAKHGNRAFSGKVGSADVFEALGVRVDLDASKAQECLDAVGMVFLFAPNFHPLVKQVSQVRKEIGIRTIFNSVGPLVNPARVKRYLLGVFREDYVEKMALVLQRLGAEKALVVHGSGLDECSTIGETKVCEVEAGKLSRYSITPEEFGFKRAKLADLQGGDAARNAQIITAVLSGIFGPARDAVLLNAGAALFAAGKVSDISMGIKLSEESIDSGRAMEKLGELRKATNNA